METKSMIKKGGLQMKPRNKEYVRRTKIFILVCALIAGMLAPGATLHVAAAPKWKTAYKKILKNWKTVEKYEDMSYLKPELFTEQYLN